MRKHFITTLLEQAKKDSSIFVLVGDLGYGVFDEFASLFPDRYINVGVAEQNMTGLASGLAMEGYKVLTYSIGNFNTLRCLEQIRNDICYHNLDVKIVSAGAGFSYGSAGYTHFAIEDIGAMRIMPNMRIYSPSTINETKLVTELLFLRPGPAYLRVGSHVHSNNCIVKENEISHICDGEDILVLTTGNILANAFDAVSQLLDNGLKIKLGNVHTLVPFDDAFFLKYCENIKQIVTVEEHGISGLFSIISELVAKNKLKIAITPILVDSGASCYAESQMDMRKRYLLDSEGIRNVIVSIAK